MLLCSAVKGVATKYDCPVYSSLRASHASLFPSLNFLPDVKQMRAEDSLGVAVLLGAVF